jgi:hypothetical protein
MSEKLERCRVLLADDVEAGASAFVLKCRIGDDLVRLIQTTRSVTPAADA